MTMRSAAQGRLTASEVEARVRLLLEHHHRASRSTLAGFCNLSLRDFDAALAANPPLADHVLVMRNAVKTLKHGMGF